MRKSRFYIITLLCTFCIFAGMWRECGGNVAGMWRECDYVKQIREPYYIKYTISDTLSKILEKINCVDETDKKKKMKTKWFF